MVWLVSSKISIQRWMTGPLSQKKEKGMEDLLPKKSIGT